MNYGVKFAKSFKERNNAKIIGNVIGTVLSITPLKIGILGNEVMLDNTNCFLCSNLVENYKRNAIIKNTDTNIITNVEVTFKDILKVGDKVLVLPNVDEQIFYIVDKVVM
ncbi:DUF2577 family protein [Clostridium sp. CF012]|uniref:DUF2577 family protein n=1 Tax=Clostridium sp. CF012 TaxID=2843319 RepID=UPI001C0BD9FF|nr:DUF2577 family protein [Clostridium sp. CF012]MBU3145029.1 DUF2577 domain-containing protein [Clostridium sp. CF012]